MTIVEKIETHEFSEESNPFLKGIEVKHSPKLKIVSDLRKVETDFGEKMYIDVEVEANASKTDLHEYTWHIFDGTEWVETRFEKEQIEQRHNRKRFTYTPNKTSFNTMIDLLGNDTSKWVSKSIVCRVENRIVKPKEVADLGLDGMPMDTIMVEGAN
jgi:hypothetical protein